MPNLIKHVQILFPNRAQMEAKCRGVPLNARGGRNASYYYTSQVFLCFVQIQYEETFKMAIRAAWAWPDVSGAPAVPMTTEELTAYFIEVDPTKADALAFVREVLALLGEPIPEHFGDL